ncbi:MAG: DUF2663 family protein [Acholeplasmataceae bacterium]|jgi:cytochrome bd-type quinol oxidase subunit 2|nr:DUF2663 family protein [Acholeplasmataceae bacterium]
MKIIAIIAFTIVLISFVLIQVSYMLKIQKNQFDEAKKTSWSSLFLISIATYILFVFTTDYIGQDSFQSNLNQIQNLIFMLYLILVFVVQIMESIHLRKKEDKLGMLVIVPFLSKAMSILFFMAYLAIYTLP